MKAMQKLQPQINALKEKYKDDAQKFGQEQLALFRAHKVNPAGGCLPILVQLPVFIALYAVLQNSIELFHAPFFGWVQDLSAKDPYYVFPALMGVSMFVQQKMTPAAGMDPTQQKILLLMPVIFSVVMLNLPSGLTAYIFLSTLLGILQQLLMNREQGKDTAPLVTAPQSPSGK
jgi:YidC/Oxa1 family membrane protein insertase